MKTRRIATAVAVVIVAIIALVGCKSPKTVTEVVTEHVHDTVTVHHADTVREVKVTHHTDTVLERETHTYTLTTQGDTVKEVHHHYSIEKTIVLDSTQRYKATVDSLRAALHDAKSHEKVIVKTKYLIRWWEWCIVALLAAVFLVAVLRKSIKKF